MARYNLFISHSWAYGDKYDRMCEMLDSQVTTYGFNYKNYSVPKNDPIHNAPSEAKLKEAIRAQIRPASVVVIMAGVYSTYSKWINIEIELAREMGKKILAVEPWGSERTSLTVKNAADKIVGWNSSSIVFGIESLVGAR
ncbi:TIR domain-containing protein [Aeromonas enteropelogenes]|uniref:TIR domain-containing protein n=1 Tax=Aeromonas enteropelogenes TaxID=29489 RepID=UPI003BA07066